MNHNKNKKYLKKNFQKTAKIFQSNNKQNKLIYKVQRNKPIQIKVGMKKKKKKIRHVRNRCDHNT